MNKTKRTRQEKGITLVALIITIIVLLILAVVAIRAVQGDGIIGHAKNAENEYEKKALEENTILGGYLVKIEENIPGSNVGGNNPPVGTITLAEAQSDAMLSKTTNSKTADIYGNKIVVPAGFKILVDSTTVYNETNIDVTKGIVIQDASGNEFVWIPVGNIKTSRTDTAGTPIILGRYSWDGSTPTLVQPQTGKNTYTSEVAITSNSDDYIELQPTESGKGTNGNAIARNINDFYLSAINNCGYYIGRYEAGNSKNTLICKANQTVYGGATISKASSLSQAMYSNGYSTGTFSSDLVNSYAWDTAIVFIQTFGGCSDYAIKNLSTSFAKTGANQANGVPDKYCNIYDMSGNAYELTTETSNFDGRHSTYRGGWYYPQIGSNTKYTAIRWSVNGNSYQDCASFRPLLYVALNA